MEKLSQIAQKYHYRAEVPLLRQKLICFRVLKPQYKVINMKVILSKNSIFALHYANFKNMQRRPR